MNPIISQSSVPAHQAAGAAPSPMPALSPPRPRRRSAAWSRVSARSRARPRGRGADDPGSRTAFPPSRSGARGVLRECAASARTARGKPESSTTPPRAARRRSARSKRQGHARKEVGMTRSFAGGMPQTTIVLVFRDSCGCSPFPRLRLGRGHQGGRSIASWSTLVKVESRHPAPGRHTHPTRQRGFRGTPRADASG